ncbi:polysaccharide biosynthesis C-terminal domain-containing protein, partial [Lactobacillus gallinarum]
ASTGLFMLSKEVIYIVSGPHYFKAISSLRILCFSYIFSVLAWILSDCVLIPAKREKYMLRSTTFSAIINIVFNLILIPFYSENAAAFSTVLAEITMFIVNYHYTKDIVNTIFISKYFWRNFVSSLLGCVGIIIVCVLCNIGWQSLILKTAFSIVLSIIIYGAILVLLRNEIALNMLSKLKIIMHKL